LTDPLEGKGKVQKISSVNGMAKKTAEQFVKEIPEFLAFLRAAHLEGKLTQSQSQSPTLLALDKSHPLYGKKWVMTGFRDKELIATLLAYGSEQGTAVNKKTAFLIVKNSDEDNVKVADAKQLGIPVLTSEEVNVMFNL
jgi:NAD-dependent DNA ligase